MLLQALCFCLKLLEIFLKPAGSEPDYYWFMVNIDGSFPYQGICHGD